MRLKITVPHVRLHYADRTEMKAVMRRAGGEVAAAAKALIRFGGKGRVSKPGEPPASKTGELVRSIKAKPWKSGWGVRIVASAFYSGWLERGAQGGGNPGKNAMVINPKTSKPKRARGVFKTRVLAPRPFMSVALERVNDRDIGARIASAVASGIKFERTK